MPGSRRVKQAVSWQREIDFLKKSIERSLSLGCHMARSMQSDVEIDEMNIVRDKSGKQGSSSDSIRVVIWTLQSDVRE